LKSVNECVTTKLPNALALKMNGAQTINESEEYIYTSQEKEETARALARRRQ